MESVSIIVVNFNSYDFLIKCLESLLPFIDDTGSEIIVIDNNSNRKDFTGLNSQFGKVKIIVSEKNYGFANANNKAAIHCKNNVLLFLNPDTVITSDFVSPILEFIRKNANVGACAPMLLNENRDYQSSSGPRMGLVYECLEAFMMIGLIRNIMKYRYIKRIDSNKPIRVGWVSGACLILKKSVFEEVGGFTEDYFLNYEDIDLCRKLEDKGYINYYFPSLNCVHLDHRSFSKNYELLIYSRYDSRLKYASLYYSLFARIAIRIIHIAGLLLRLSICFFVYSGPEMRTRMKGYLRSLKLYLGIKNTALPIN